MVGNATEESQCGFKKQPRAVLHSSVLFLSCFQYIIIKSLGGKVVDFEFNMSLHITYCNHSLTMCCVFLSQVSSLVLYVEEAHKLPVKYFNSPYCNIYLNSVQVAKTHHREGQNPVFTEEFIFE